jgi:hypothetical protein
VLLAAALAASTVWGCTIDYNRPDPSGILITNETDEPVRIVLVYDNADETDLGTIEANLTLDLEPGDLTREGPNTNEFGDRLEARDADAAVIEEFEVVTDTDPQIGWHIDGQPDPPPDQDS